MDNETTVTGSALTIGTIVKIGFVEWIVFELLLLGFLLLQQVPANRLQIDLNGRTLGSSGNVVADFVVLSLMVLAVTVVLSVCLIIGQTILRSLFRFDLGLVVRS